MKNLSSHFGPGYYVLDGLDRYKKAQLLDDCDVILSNLIKKKYLPKHALFYLFPVYKGICFSVPGRYFALQNLSECRRFLEDGVLQKRLLKSCDYLLSLDELPIKDIVGADSTYKIQASMTLFSRMAPGTFVFQKVLNKFFAGADDIRTVQLLGLELMSEEQGSYHEQYSG